MMDFIKGHKLNFKEFNNHFCTFGNFAYVIKFKDKKAANYIEDKLYGIDFKMSYGEGPINWNNVNRKNFIITINPKHKIFFRNRQLLTFHKRYRFFFLGEYFNDFCFKFVITEKFKYKSNNVKTSYQRR